MNCTLCGLTGSKGTEEESQFFCCKGCRTVWYLLSAKGETANYKDHPVFRQAIQSGLISNPELKFAANSSTEQRRISLEIGEMWCPSCAEVIEILLRLEKGVINCRVDYATDLASIDYDPCKISEEAIYNFIDNLGYKAVSFESLLGRKIDRSLYLRFFVAAFCALNVMMLSYPLYATYFNYETQEWGQLLAWISLGFSVPVMTYSAYPIAKRFLNSLKSGLYGMESLVVIGTVSAFTLSLYSLSQGKSEVYFDTLTVIIALVLMGKIIETKAKMTAKESFYELARSLPQRARVEGEFVSLKDIQAGQIIEVLTGERIPLDGVVTQGEALLDESASTGESAPLLKTLGDTLKAGGVIESGRLLIKVEGTESLLNKMVEACLVNLDNKALYIRSLDPFVRIFVPLILLIASLLFLYTGSFEQSLAVLVIACPCAIGIAAPLVEARLIQVLAEKGAIVRNRGCLFKIPDATRWIFDKTGTLTEGKLTLEGLDQLTESEKYNLKGLAQLSRHPVSLSIAYAIQGKSKCYQEVHEKQGLGIKGEGAWLGSRVFFEDEKITLPPIKKGSEVWYYEGTQPYRLGLKDSLRQEAKEILAQLPGVYILSGDKEDVVEEVARELKVVQWKGQTSPLQKKEVISQLKEKGQVIFIGDGLNDAPALTEAHVGVATASSLGLAQAACDILLTTSSLKILPSIKVYTTRARRLIRQNLFWAFFYNIVGVGLAVAGLLTPLFAAFAMTASSLMVLINSFRTLGQES